MLSFFVLYNDTNPYSKVVGSLSVCLSVCKFPHKSKTAEPIKLKFCDKLPHFWDSVLVKNKFIQNTFSSEIGSFIKNFERFQQQIHKHRFLCKTNY